MVPPLPSWTAHYADMEMERNLMDQIAKSPLPVPDHVPQDRVVDYDVYHFPEGKRGMMEHTADVMTKAPGVFFSPRNEGHWLLADYDSVHDAIRDTATFSSQPYIIPACDEPPLWPLFLNPPEHAPFRAIMDRFFTPRTAMSMADHIRTTAIDLIEAVRPDGYCEFVDSVAELLPVSVFLDLLGLPREMIKDYRSAAKIIVGSTDSQEKEKTFMWVQQELAASIAERRRKPREDMITSLMDCEVNGHKLTDEEILNLCLNLFSAGLDSVTVTMSYGVQHLAQNGQLQSWARENPARIPELAEELLRRYSVNQSGRTVTRDVDFHGVHMKKGDRVMLLISAANFDPAAFDNPLAVNPDREKRPHLAFGAGPHRCVGAHLARVELRILYEEWLARIPTFRPDPDKQPEYRGGSVFAVHNLWLRWDNG
jgi:cytochrome P450